MNVCRVVVVAGRVDLAYAVEDKVLTVWVGSEVPNAPRHATRTRVVGPSRQCVIAEETLRPRDIGC